MSRVVVKVCDGGTCTPKKTSNLLSPVKPLGGAFKASAKYS